MTPFLTAKLAGQYVAVDAIGLLTSTLQVTFLSCCLLLNLIVVIILITPAIYKGCASSCFGGRFSKSIFPKPG